MSEASTVYDVQVRYSIEDRASAPVDHIGATAQKAEQKVLGLRDTLQSVGAAVAAWQVFDKGRKLLVDFNSEIEQSKISIATISRMFGQSPDFQSAMRDAEGLFGRYQDAAKKSTATTKEFLDMHLSLAPTFAKFGAQGKVIEDIVKGSTVAAPVLGEKPETFAMDVKQMLQGSVTLRDRSAVSLLSMMGIEREEFNKRTKEDINYAIDTIHKALTSPALGEGTKQMENSFAGAASTLVDTVQIEGAKAGKSFFDAVKGELNALNAWIVAHSEQIATFGKEFGSALVGAFHAIRDAVGFLIDHKSEIMTIAAAWAVSKIGGGIAGGIGGMLGNAGGALGGVTYGEGAAVNFAGKLLGVVDQRAQSVALGSFKSNAGMLASSAAGGGLGGLVRGELLVASMKGFPDAMQVAQKALIGFGAATALGLGKIETATLTVSGALSALPGPIGLAATAFTLLLPALHGIVKLGDSYAESVQKLDDQDYYDGKMPEFWQRGVYDRRKEERQKEYERARDQDIGTDEEFKKRLGGGFNLTHALMSPSVRALFDQKPQKTVKPGNTNVTIHKIEVVSDDPDRFAFGLGESFERMARNPTSARDALRGGY